MEHRAKSTNVSSYFPIPPDNDLCVSVVQQCSRSAASRVSCMQSVMVLWNLCILPMKAHESRPYPVYGLFNGLLWPVVCISKVRTYV